MFARVSVCLSRLGPDRAVNVVNGNAKDTLHPPACPALDNVDLRHPSQPAVHPVPPGLFSAKHRQWKY